MKEIVWTESFDGDRAEMLRRMKEIVEARPGWRFVDATEWPDFEFEKSLAAEKRRGPSQEWGTWYVRTQIAILIHHVVADGWSIAVVMGEIKALLDQLGR